MVNVYFFFNYMKDIVPLTPLKICSLISNTLFPSFFHFLKWKFSFLRVFSCTVATKSVQNINLSWSFWLEGKARHCTVPDLGNKVEGFLQACHVGWHSAAEFTVSFSHLIRHSQRGPPNCFRKRQESTVWQPWTHLISSGSGKNRVSIFKVKSILKWINSNMSSVIIFKI